jgi:8-oxo-dGTP pyrophosphatase MutT (NUDIX family)
MTGPASGPDPVVAPATPVGTPEWLEPLVSACSNIGATDLSRFIPPTDGSGRHSAVLMLFGSETGLATDAEVLLLLRAASMRNHAGQVAFPGGATDRTDASATATALREAVEEVGLRPDTVDPLLELPAIFLPPSGFVVTPVLGHWREPHQVGVVDEQEVAAVRRVALTGLVAPANRFTVRHPSGFSGPGFAVDDLFIWGFTAGLLDRMIRWAGWEQPWDASISRPIPGV